MNCPFCSIIEADAPASIIYEDEQILAIVPLHSSYPEAGVVMPKKHIDHFTDLPDALAAQIMVIGQKIGRRIKAVTRCERVGMTVHGYGVPHAHLNVFPQNHRHDITSRQFAYTDGDKVKFGASHIKIPSRSEMDKIAERLKLEE